MIFTVKIDIFYIETSPFIYEIAELETKINNDWDDFIPRPPLHGVLVFRFSAWKNV